MLDNDSLMPWGKHKGKKMEDISPDYFKYLWDKNMCWGEVKDYLILNMKRINERLQNTKAA